MGTRKKTKRARGQSSSPAMQVVDVGNQIWLAGLGALARAQKEGQKLFQSLVTEGRTLQTNTREATEEAITSAIDELRGAITSRTDAVRDKATETWDNVEKIFQSRVQKALQQLGVPTAREINALSRKVDELNRGVQELARARTTERRTTTRKARAATPAHGEQSASV